MANTSVPAQGGASSIRAEITTDSMTGDVTLLAGDNVTLTQDETARTITIEAAGGSGSPGGSDTAVQFNDSDTFGGDATKFAFDVDDSKLSLLSTNYDFVLDPSSGEFSGVQAVIGPVDDDLVITSTATNNLTLACTDAANSISFKFNGHADFKMGDGGVFYLDAGGGIVDFLDAGVEIGYLSCFAGELSMDSKNGGVVYVGTGSPTATSGAKFEVKSTTGGILFPRMTEVQRDAIVSPDAGLVIYNTDDAKLNVFTTTWEVITSI